MGGQREGEGGKEKEGNREGIHPRPAMTSGSVMGHQFVVTAVV